MRYNLIITSLMLVLLSGCAFYSHEAYPKNWSSLPAISNCPCIEGHYDNKGESDENNSRINFLSPILLGSMIKNPYAVNSVKITQEKDELIFEAHTNESEIIKRIVNLRDVKCAKGLLEIKAQDPQGLVSGDNVIGYESNVIQLAKDYAGSLILRFDSKGFGIVMLIPFAGSDWQWYKFPPITVPPIKRPKKTSVSGEDYIKQFP